MGFRVQAIRTNSVPCLKSRQKIAKKRLNDVLSYYPRIFQKRKSRLDGIVILVEKGFLTRSVVIDLVCEDANEKSCENCHSDQLVLDFKHGGATPCDELEGQETLNELPHNFYYLTSFNKLLQ